MIRLVLRDRSRRIVGSPAFHHATIALIVLNAVALGVEAQLARPDSEMAWLGLAHVVIGLLFVVEILLRVTAAASIRDFLRDGWNVFDAAVVAVSLLPAVGALAMLARLARLLRLARLVSAVPELRILVATMARSIVSMGHLGILLALLLYGYAVVGVHAFGAVDPLHWGGLGAALLSLFQILTLEGWVEMQRQVAPHAPWAWLYFTSFIVIAVFMLVNLFIAVVINNLEAAKTAERERSRGEPGPALPSKGRIWTTRRHTLSRPRKS